MHINSAILAGLLGAVAAQHADHDPSKCSQTSRGLCGKAHQVTPTPGVFLKQFQNMKLHAPEKKLDKSLIPMPTGVKPTKRELPPTNTTTTTTTTSKPTKQVTLPTTTKPTKKQVTWTNTTMTTTTTTTTTAKRSAKAVTLPSTLTTTAKPTKKQVTSATATTTTTTKRYRYRIFSELRTIRQEDSPRKWIIKPTGSKNTTSPAPTVKPTGSKNTTSPVPAPTTTPTILERIKKEIIEKGAKNQTTTTTTTTTKTKKNKTKTKTKTKTTPTKPTLGKPTTTKPSIGKPTTTKPVILTEVHTTKGTLQFSPRKRGEPSVDKNKDTAPPAPKTSPIAPKRETYLAPVEEED